MALLLRDIVSRHGRLPLAIVADRGSEMWSKMIIEFAAQYQITLHMRPAGAPRYGSQIENALREINANVAHCLVGSTLPDQKGRATDGRYKSYKTAKLTFRIVVDVVDKFLFETWPSRPRGAEGFSPDEKRDMLGCFPSRGREVANNGDFLVATSVPVRWSTSSSKVIRANRRDYGSTELAKELQNARPTDFRLDCANPSVGYAKFAGGWVRAFTNTALENAIKNELDRIFRVIYEKDHTRQVRRRLRESRNEHFDRVDLANASAHASRDVMPPPAAKHEQVVENADSSAAASQASNFKIRPLQLFEE